jgi:hypothetical protein
VRGAMSTLIEELEQVATMLREEIGTSWAEELARALCARIARIREEEARLRAARPIGNEDWDKAAACNNTFARLAGPIDPR